MTTEISYGPHLFPGGPLFYVKTGTERIGNFGKRSIVHRDVSLCHEEVLHTLTAAFTNQEESVYSKLNSRFQFAPKSEVNLAFMNYGNTQLVYLATIGNCVGPKHKFAVLINQPHTPLGVVKQEFENLARLKELDPRFVVEPFAHFALPRKGHELYAAQYIENALCLAVQQVQGFYDPLPNYHFEAFPEESELDSRVNSSMIALLVNYYDHERKRGLAATQISGNDFMLTRDFKKEDPKTILPSMKLIAARGFVDAPLNDYTEMLKHDFITGTTRTTSDLKRFKINHKSGLPLKLEDITHGIKRGLELRKERGV